MSSVVSAAKEMLKAYVKGDESAIHPNIRRAVFAIALQHGHHDEYDAVLQALQATTSHDERYDMLRGLGYFRDPEIVQKVLDLLLTDKFPVLEVSPLTTSSIPLIQR